MFFPPNGLRTLYQQVLVDLIDRHHILPPRRLRANPRVVKRKVSKFPVKRAKHRQWPQPVRTSAEAVRISA